MKTKKVVAALFGFLMLVLPAAAQVQELPLGSKMPLADRAWTAVDGSQMNLAGARGTKGTVVVFWSNECPWASKAEARLLALRSQFADRGINFILVNANDAVAFPKEGAAEGSKRKYPMPYLMDNKAELAAAFGASRSPHVFVFGSDNTLVFVGTIDDSPGDPGNVKNAYLKDALDAIVSGGAIAMPQTKAFGCTIKFPSGQ